MLVDDVNTGYQQFQSLQVLRVNGTEVLNLPHLQQLVEKVQQSTAREAGDGATSSTTTTPAAGIDNGSSSSSSNSEGSSAAGGDGMRSGSFIVSNNDGRYVCLELEDDRQLVMDCQAAEVAAARIMDRYRIPANMSADVAAVGEQDAAKP